MISASFSNINAWGSIRERVYDFANSNGNLIALLESTTPGPESEISGRSSSSSIGLPVANAPDVLHPCGLLYYP
jgi:hypothetical protein